jgi:hypothetical protein
MSSEESGHIAARNIKAENVVLGIQSFDASDARQIMDAARRLRTGSIKADEISAINIVSGVQIYDRSEQVSVSALQDQIKSIRDQLASLDTDSSDFVTPDDRDDALADLDKLRQELAKDEPQASRTKRITANVNDVLDGSASAAENAGRLTTALSTLALQGAALWQSVQQFFGQ